MTLAEFSLTHPLSSHSSMAVSASTLSSSHTASGKKSSVKDWTKRCRRMWSKALVSSCRTDKVFCNQHQPALPQLLLHDARRHGSAVNGWMVDGWMFPTSDFSDRPLLKKISDTATYAIVISGFKGPGREKDRRVFVKSLFHNFKI